MGSLFGGLLAEGGVEVTLVDIWREHVDAINERGLTLASAAGQRRIPVRAALSTADMSPADLVFVQCKAVDGRAALRSAMNVVGPDTLVISFQNGLGNAETLSEEAGAERVLGGLTAQAASVESAGVVRGYGDLPSWIGELDGGVSARVAELAEFLSAHGLPMTASADIRLDIWKKLMVNVGLSALSGIMDMRIREVLASAELRALVDAAIDEAVLVGRAEGHDLDGAAAREVLERIAGPGGSGENKPSLCHDLRRGRRTEVDFFNGAIVSLGRRHGVATPVNAVLHGIVKAMEADAVREKKLKIN